MKKTGIIILLMMFLALAWFGVISGYSNISQKQGDAMQKATESVEKGLYEQAIESYKEVLKYDSSKAVYDKIVDAYEMWYEEDKTSYIRNTFISDLEVCQAAYPLEESYYTREIELYLSMNDYTKAYGVVARAHRNEATGEKLESYYADLLYMVKLSYQTYSSVVTALNGYNSVCDGSVWTVIDDNGNSLRSNYVYVSILNSKGKGVFVRDDARLMDNSEVARARYSTNIISAGYYNENDDVIPVETEEGWKYMKSDGSFIGSTYDFAGSFDSNEAVAIKSGKFVKVTGDGTEIALDFEDIKFDLYGCHNQSGIVIAKKNGKYRFYDTSFNQVADFAADDTDINLGGLIAFCVNGKWGYAGSDGTVEITPSFADAKSFSGNYAAVCNEEGKWGFIDKSGKLVIDYQYADALYFTSANTCFVAQNPGRYQIMSFMFE